MGLIGRKPDVANWVECEKKHGFDLVKNPRGCPLCEIERKSQLLENTTGLPTNLISKPPRIKILEKGSVNVDEISTTIGTHPWFNTLFSGKAACRVLENIREANKNVSLQNLLDACKKAFTDANLTQYRGFPKNIENQSSFGRLAFHFLQAYSDLGLLVFKTGDNNIDYLPSRGWDKVNVMLTQAGAEFIMLSNKIFDEQKPIQQLTDEERAWFINHLKQIDKKGFAEYRLLSDFVSFLKRKPTKSEELYSWFLAYKPFKQFLGVNSDKDRAENLAITLSGSKLALLRELGIVSNERNNYMVTRELK